jgi:hypothetical protein
MKRCELGALIWLMMAYLVQPETGMVPTWVLTITKEEEKSNE